MSDLTKQIERDLLDRYERGDPHPIIKTVERIAHLETAFGHYHTQVEDMRDSACGECGLDLRDTIHYRANDLRLVK